MMEEKDLMTVNGERLYSNVDVLGNTVFHKVGIPMWAFSPAGAINW